MNHLKLSPRISEKAIALAEKGTYVFDVPTSTNKIEVAAAVEQAFKVKVADVNMMIVKGKAVNWRRGSKRTPGRRRDVKKALVTLQAGQKISLFDEGAK